MSHEYKAGDKVIDRDFETIGTVSKVTKHNVTVWYDDEEDTVKYGRDEWDFDNIRKLTKLELALK